MVIIIIIIIIIFLVLIQLNVLTLFLSPSETCLYFPGGLRRSEQMKAKLHLVVRNHDERRSV